MINLFNDGQDSQESGKLGINKVFSNDIRISRRSAYLNDKENYFIKLSCTYSRINFAGVRMTSRWSLILEGGTSLSTVNDGSSKYEPLYFLYPHIYYCLNFIFLFLRLLVSIGTIFKAT